MYLFLVIKKNICIFAINLKPTHGDSAKYYDKTTKQ